MSFDIPSSIFIWLTSIFGVLMSLSWFSQAYRIWKNKSSKDVSLTFLAIFVVGNLIWFFYGMYLSNFPLIFSFGIGLIGVAVVFILSFYYR